MLQGGAHVIDCRLAVLNVEGSRFEENVGAGGGKPFANVGGLLIVWGVRPRPPSAGAQIRIRSKKGNRLQPVRVRNPSNPPRGDPGDTIRNSVALA
jgi:hypothetical protein